MLIDLIGRIFYNTMLVISLYVIEKRKINLKDKNFYFAIIVLNLLSFTLMSFKIIEIKPILNIFSLIFVDTYILKNKLSNSIIKILIMYIVFILIELIFLLFIILIFDAYSMIELNNILDKINSTNNYSFLYNVILSIIFIIIFSCRVINKIYKKILSLLHHIQSKGILINFCFIFFIFLLTYIVLNFSDKLLLNLAMLLVLIIIISIIFFRELKVRNEYEDTKERYNSTKQSLLEYEDMIDKYRVNNHENKNQLLTIQNMIKHNDKNISNYIDDLVGNVYMTNEKIMMDVSIIPAGGLRATIHSKLNIMDNKHIKYILNIDRKLRTINFENINSELNLKLCKIISIFIDNAIDEVETHEEPKIVNMEMYLDTNNMTIEVSNKFNNKFDIEKIEEKKYTTKSNGHGYGLSLAKELIDSEPCLTNYKTIEDNVFTQILKVTMKK